MLHLLLSGGTQLQETQNSHQHKEDDGFCLSHAAAACTGVEGVDDIQRQHFGGLNDLAALLDKGSAGGQRQVLVVQQMVMEGITLGMVIFHSVCQPLAPSIRAASSISSGTLCSPAT